MKKEWYDLIREWFLAKQGRMVCLKTIYSGMPFLVFIAYAVLLLILFIQKDDRLIETVCIPFAVFSVTSVIRKIINKPRPGVVLQIESLIPKTKTGESFPSRHVLSASVIGAACFSIHIVFGCVMAAFTIVIAVSRVLAGVHFINDVVWGALIGYGIGGVLLWVI